MQKETEVLVVGAGPAGLLAAIRAARMGARVLLLEKNKILGKKLRITGKGRCNLTNTGDLASFISQFGEQGPFLYSAFSRFFNDDLCRLLAEAGVAVKEERGGRIFPACDQAAAVAAALEELALEAGVTIHRNCRVQSLILTAPDGAVDPGAACVTAAADEGAAGAAYPTKTTDETDGYACAMEMRDEGAAVGAACAAETAGKAAVTVLEPAPDRGAGTTVAAGAPPVPDQSGASGASPAKLSLPASGVRGHRKGRKPGEATSPFLYRVTGVRLYDPWDDGEVTARAVILATGGRSYPLTGSTGDAYAWAEAAGHTVIEPRPALVPFETSSDWVAALSGLALKNVGASLWAGGPSSGGARRLAAFQGEMLFAHFGLTGPIILSLSRFYRRDLPGPVWVSIDLKPALSFETLDRRLQRDFAKYQRKRLAGAMADLLPKALIPAVIREAGLSELFPAAELTREGRHRLGQVLKALPVAVAGTRPWEEAIVTAGGVALTEVQPRTMASKKAAGLYFAGELLDVDAYTGGYNLQAAFSTGWVAGESAAVAAATAAAAEGAQSL